MKDKFQMSSMGELTFFLGLQVKQKPYGIFISQDKYVAEILRKFGLTDGKSTSTPIDTEKPLLKDPNREDLDVHIYSQENFKYLKGKPHLGLWYLKDSPFNLVAYSDSDYAGASLDRKSTIGGCQFFGCRLISWQCKKQTVVATSSTEAEYVAAASCCTQVLWVQNQLLDYGAFLYGTIKEEVYVCQPLGFEDPDYPDKVYKVVNILYGLHQAPRAWYETLANYLLENGFQRGKIDQTLFIKKQKGDILLVQKQDGIFISQDKYLAKILRKFGLTDGKLASTPTDTEMPLLKDPYGEDVDVYTYRFLHLIIRAQVDDLSSHTTKYSSPALIQKVFANMRKGRKGFFWGRNTFFEGMLVPQQVVNDVTDVVVDDVAADDVSTADAEPTPPSPTPATTPPPLQELLYTSQVAPTPPPSPIAPPSSPPQQPTTISMELLNTLRMHPNRGIIADLDADKDVTLDEVDVEKNAEDDEPEPAELKEIIEVVTTAKLMTKVVIAAATTITYAPITATKITVAPSAAKKGKEPKPLKNQAQIEQNKAYARELEAELNKNINWDDVIEHVKRKEKEDNVVLSLEESKRHSWFSKSQKLEIVRVLLSAYHNIYNYTDDLAGREKISIDKTLMLEEESRSKMLLKQSDPKVLEKNVNIKPFNYAELNRLSKDFGKYFPQQDLSDEQAFRLQTSHHNTDQSASTLVKIAALSKLPKTLMLEEESRSKMLLKQSDPKVLEKNVNIKPFNYAELNRLSKDFGKYFLQQDLSNEQAFRLRTSHHNTDQSASTLVKIAALSKLPK
nr:hypothetical protein [Tanacetum cinerariifolium]